MLDDRLPSVRQFYRDSKNPGCAPLAHGPAGRFEGDLGRFKRYRGLPTTTLPPPSLPENSLRGAIEGRLSCRQMKDEALPLGSLSTLLHGSLGVLGESEVAGKPLTERPVPSGGARFPLEAYLFAREVEGLPRGLHHYAPREHALSQLRGPLPWAAVVRLFLDQRWLDRAAAILLFTAVLPRTLRGYGPRGFRFVFIEAGHAAQNLCLLAGAEGLGSLCLAGFHDEQVADLLELDPRVEIPIYAVALGVPSTTDRKKIRKTDISPE